MPHPTDSLKCPGCNALMQNGFVPVSGGMHFVRGDGRSASAFAESLPGTNAIMRVNRLPAWRCKACKLILFRYGRDSARQIDRELGTGQEDIEPAEDAIDEDDEQRERESS